VPYILYKCKRNNLCVYYNAFNNRLNCKVLITKNNNDNEQQRGAAICCRFYYLYFMIKLRPIIRIAIAFVFWWIFLAICSFVTDNKELGTNYSERLYYAVTGFPHAGACIAIIAFNTMLGKIFKRLGLSPENSN